MDLNEKEMGQLTDSWFGVSDPNDIGAVQPSSKYSVADFLITPAFFMDVFASRELKMVEEYCGTALCEYIAGKENRPKRKGSHPATGSTQNSTVNEARKKSYTSRNDMQHGNENSSLES